MKTIKFSPRLLIGIIITLCFGISLIFRICLPYDQVFSGDWIKFTSIDAYYQMRIVDNMTYNFPHLTDFDPYLIYPGGGGFGEIHFFNWLLSGVNWVFGLGSPTQHTVDVIGVYFPAILAALTVIPVYFIGKALFNRWAGVIAAALTAMLPGEYLGRTILGFTDQHVAETLFATIAMLFLILAIKTASQRQLTLGHFIQRDWKVIIKPLIYSLLAGIFLGIYLITWLGGLLFVFIIALYFIIQFIIDHLKQKSTLYLGVIGFILFLIAMIIYLPFAPYSAYKSALYAAVVIPLVFAVISMLMSGRVLKPLYYLPAIVGAGVVIMAIFYLVAPGTLKWMFSQFAIFAPKGATATTTLEMQPFLYPRDFFSTSVAWGNFNTSFFLSPWWLIPGLCFAALCGLLWFRNKKEGYDKSLLIGLCVGVVVMIIVVLTRYSSNYNLDVVAIPGIAMISLGFLVWLYTRQRSDERRRLLLRISALLLLIVAFAVLNASIISSVVLLALFFVLLIWLAVKQDNDYQSLLLFLVWSLTILALTLIQRRFAYYLVINIALLSAYLSWRAIWLAGLGKLATRPKEKVEAVTEGSLKVKSKKGRGESQGITIIQVNVALAIVMVFLLVIYPNINMAKDLAAQPRFAPSDAWQASLEWMKQNTPEPLGDPDAYYDLYETPPREGYSYPDTAYGVTSWWDYGYWISRIAHRFPSANPSQAAEPIKKVATLFLTQEESQTHEIMEQLNSSYIITDQAVSTSKFWAVMTWAEQKESNFSEVYLLPYEGDIVPVQLFYPEFYETLFIRLHNFDGKAVEPEGPAVVTYTERVDSDGNQHKVISEIKDFPSYQEAVDYIEDGDSASRRIVGINPFISPVPLEALQHYRLIFSSEQKVSFKNVTAIPEVKIFEYIK